MLKLASAVIVVLLANIMTGLSSSINDMESVHLNKRLIGEMIGIATAADLQKKTQEMTKNEHAKGIIANRANYEEPPELFEQELLAERKKKDEIRKGLVELVNDQTVFWTKPEVPGATLEEMKIVLMNSERFRGFEARVSVADPSVKAALDKTNQQQQLQPQPQQQL